MSTFALAAPLGLDFRLGTVESVEVFTWVRLGGNHPRGGDGPPENPESGLFLPVPEGPLLIEGKGGDGVWIYQGDNAEDLLLAVKDGIGAAEYQEQALPVDDRLRKVLVPRRRYAWIVPGPGLSQGIVTPMGLIQQGPSRWKQRTPLILGGVILK